jgi:hypothetical protein
MVLLDRQTPSSSSRLAAQSLRISSEMNKLGFTRTEAQPDGETRWQLVVNEYCDKELPMQVDAAPVPGSASAA